ncbi:hypothetical protein CDV31_015414 [Fusarium ambrosium]|uniref:VWFA domain-containing protein n=1 Tax=Fusarium ambrosium TaxID=131363 RepID=A0A428SPJ2_9HYPO|nr:hypothetical protein CDV31_015414 [Fusarium ambrosium]
MVKIPFWNTLTGGVSKKKNDTESNDQVNEKLPIREKKSDDEIVGGPSAIQPPVVIASDDVSLHLEPVPERKGLIVKIQPPTAPSTEIPHVPCDIVLVIDVSGSMAGAAPVPGEETNESTGLSILDLTKHAARTIIETMNEGDRLGIVTFASKAKVVQPLLSMTSENKERSRENVTSMRPIDATNLWHGMLEGIKLFKNVKSSNVPAIMVLTDGMPNHMNPAAGFVPKLRAMGQLPASIHTFGFGYHLRSGLLKSIAEIGGGNYAFIPDAGMIGTVFVHAVANLQSTFATRAILKLTYSKHLELEETTGTSVEQQPPQPVDGSDDGEMELTLNLGNIQYGQSRDIFLRVNNLSKLESLKEKDASSSLVNASIAYLKPGGDPTTFNVASKKTPFTPVTSVRRSVLDTSDLPESEIAYHESRAIICSFISSIFPIQPDGEHEAAKKLAESKKDELIALIENLPARPFHDPKNESLKKEISSEDPKGQVFLALESMAYFNKWGCHFLPSLLNGHTRQICNSFKDPGPLQYGTESPLFISCRDLLDQAFDNLPAPEPSRAVPMPRLHGGRAHGSRSSGTRSSFLSSSISMSKYRNVSGVCFAASTDVTLASGRIVQIRKLRRGMKVRTPRGSRRVAMVLKTPVEQELLCRMGKVLVTPWHPVSSDGKRWTFPANAAEGVVLYTGCVYSVLLERDRNSSAHAIRVGDMWGVTLGHGLTIGSDVRAHSFFGDYNNVGKSLLGLGRRRHGVVIGGGVERDQETGLVRGFKASNKVVGEDV